MFVIARSNQSAEICALYLIGSYDAKPIKKHVIAFRSYHKQFLEQKKFQIWIKVIWLNKKDKIGCTIYFSTRKVCALDLGVSSNQNYKRRVSGCQWLLVENVSGNFLPNNSSAGGFPVVGWGVARYIWRVLLSYAFGSFLSTIAVCHSFLHIWLLGRQRWTLVCVWCMPIWSIPGVSDAPCQWRVGHCLFLVIHSSRVLRRCHQSHQMPGCCVPPLFL